MDAQDQLAIIAGVIERARAERVRSGDIYVGWGVIVVLGIAITLWADALGRPYGWVAWPVLCTLGMAITWWTARARGLVRETYGSRIEGAVWQSVGVVLFGLIFGGQALGLMPLESIVPIVCGLCGVAMHTSGAVYKSPLMARSGWGFIVVALISLPMTWRVQYLLMGVAVVLGYIVPGILWMRQERAAEHG